MRTEAVSRLYEKPDGKRRRGREYFLPVDMAQYFFGLVILISSLRDIYALLRFRLRIITALDYLTRACIFKKMEVNSLSSPVLKNITIHFVPLYSHKLDLIDEFSQTFVLKLWNKL